MPVVTRAEALALAERFAEDPLDGELLDAAAAARDAGWGNVVTYSPKVFIPLTKLCRDVCHYCTFARPPIEGRRAYLTLEKVLEIARAGAAAGCREALFTLGDKPESRYRAAREELAALGCETTLEYLHRAAATVLEETGLLPHLNPGLMTRDERLEALHAIRELSERYGHVQEVIVQNFRAKPGTRMAEAPEPLLDEL